MAKMRATQGLNLPVAAAEFCVSAPHRSAPYNKRNWGGTLHSLCSYQGKLKPAIAHFLVRNFTERGARVLDPMSGVGTIPLEARRQGRVAIGNDLSPLAAAVSRAKAEVFTAGDLWRRFGELSEAIAQRSAIDPDEAAFGLNGPLSAYFHVDTLAELFAARAWFQSARTAGGWDATDAVLLTGLLHILHGNRPYALSRNSHPVTPFAPSGPSLYKPVSKHLEARLTKIVPALQGLAEATPAGAAFQMDFRDVHAHVEPVDAIITSPPFSSSLRFWSSNWMRLWFAGWSAADFKTEPKRYLETEQRGTYEPYEDFAKSAFTLLRPGGTLILHLGETATHRMVDGVVPLLGERFDVRYVGSENVADTESHGLRDKGATTAHWYIFATRC